MSNKIRELSVDELEVVAGGNIWLEIAKAAIGPIVGKILDSDHTPTNVLNGMLSAIGQKPV